VTGNRRNIVKEVKSIESDPIDLTLSILAFIKRAAFSLGFEEVEFQMVTLQGGFSAEKTTIFINGKKLKEFLTVDRSLGYIDFQEVYNPSSSRIAGSQIYVGGSIDYIIKNRWGQYGLTRMPSGRLLK